MLPAMLKINPSCILGQMVQKYVWLEAEESESEEVIERIQNILNGVIHIYHPQEYTVFGVDNWFGKRWLRFSGKYLGAVGVSKGQLTFPPFVPTRLDSYGRFVWNPKVERYVRRHNVPLPHRWQNSSQNLQNRLDLVAPNGAYFWFSGKSAVNRKAALMAYVSTDDGWWTWYISFDAAHNWHSIKTVGISTQEVSEFEEIGKSILQTIS